MIQMERKELEDVIAAAIHKSHEKDGDAWTIGHNTKINIGIAGAVLLFILAAIGYGINLQKELYLKMEENRKEMLEEIKERFVQIQDFTTIRTQQDGMQTQLNNIGGDIKIIREQLDGVRFQEKKQRWLNSLSVSQSVLLSEQLPSLQANF